MEGMKYSLVIVISILSTVSAWSVTIGDRNSSCEHTIETELGIVTLYANYCTVGGSHSPYSASQSVELLIVDDSGEVLISENFPLYIGSLDLIEVDLEQGLGIIASWETGGNSISNAGTILVMNPLTNSVSTGDFTGKGELWDSNEDGLVESMIHNSTLWLPTSAEWIAMSFKCRAPVLLSITPTGNGEVQFEDVTLEAIVSESSTFRDQWILSVSSWLESVDNYNNVEGLLEMKLFAGRMLNALEEQDYYLFEDLWSDLGP